MLISYLKTCQFQEPGLSIVAEPEISLGRVRANKAVVFKDAQFVLDMTRSFKNKLSPLEEWKREKEDCMDSHRG
jgi:hypothetical protein